MEVFHLAQPLEPKAASLRPCVIALGFFDGIHIAHRALIERAAHIAAVEGIDLAVLTFDPHPREIIGRSTEPMKYLTPLDVKKELFSSLGVKRLYVVSFNQSIAALSPDDFVNQYLFRLGARHVVTGFDFRYGYRGQGDQETLRQSGEGIFDVHIVEKMSRKGIKIGSTYIRELISMGRLHLVPEYLGYYYQINGNRISGDTIRIDEQFLLPPDGEYRTEICGDGADTNAVIHILGTGIVKIAGSPDLSRFGERIGFRLLRQAGDLQAELAVSSVLARTN